MLNIIIKSFSILTLHEWYFFYISKGSSLLGPPPWIGHLLHFSHMYLFIAAYDVDSYLLNGSCLFMIHLPANPDMHFYLFVKACIQRVTFDFIFLVIDSFVNGTNSSTVSQDYFFTVDTSLHVIRSHVLDSSFLSFYSLNMIQWW